MSDLRFQLLSVVSLDSRINNGLSIEKLYDSAQRKFDTLIAILRKDINDESIISSEGYSLDNLQNISHSILQKLIFNTASNPYMTLCVSEKASLDEMKRRRNQLLNVFHPDRNSQDDSKSAMTVKINEAYEQVVNNLHSQEMNSGVTSNISKTSINNYSYTKRLYEKRFYFTMAILFVIVALFGLIWMITVY